MDRERTVQSRPADCVDAQCIRDAKDKSRLEKTLENKLRRDVAYVRVRVLCACVLKGACVVCVCCACVVCVCV